MAEEIERIVREKIKAEGEVFFLKGEINNLKEKIKDLESILKFKERDIEKLKEKIKSVANIVCGNRVVFYKKKRFW